MAAIKTCEAAGSMRQPARRRLPAVLAAVALICGTALVRAQEGNDVSRLTCAQFVQLRQPDREQLLVWLAGFYAGSAQRPVINGRLLTESAGAIDALCRAAPATPLIGDQMRALVTGLPPAGSQGAQGNIVVPGQPQAAPAQSAPAPSAAPAPPRPQPQP